MIVYTYSEARQKLATVLDKARKEGEVRIKRKDGQIFIIKPQAQKDSPLNVVGIDLDLTSEEIVATIQEGRRAY